MSTTRNTKGRTARKTAPKKAVKKPTQLDRIEEQVKYLHERLSNQGRHKNEIASRDADAHDEINDKLDQIHRDIDLLKSGSSFMQEIEQHKAQPEEQGLEKGDWIEATKENVAVVESLNLPTFAPILRNPSNDNITWDGMEVIGAGRDNTSACVTHRPDFLARARVTAKKLGLAPEDPKAEPWEPKVGSVVVDVADPRRTTARVMECLPIGVWKIHWPGKHDSYLSDDQLAPATVEEIAAHERSEKLEKLVRGCRVDTPDGEGIYLGCDTTAEGHRPYWVSLDREAGAPGTLDYFNLDQLTPLP